MNLSKIAMTALHFAISLIALPPCLAISSPAGELGARVLPRSINIQTETTIFGLDSEMIRKSVYLNWSFEPKKIIGAFEHNDQKTLVDVPSEYKTYASGLSSKSWRFSASEMNLKVKRLFQIIATKSLWGFEVHLNRNDLFHGHIFTVNYGDYADIAILFHSKEYPNDPEIVAQNNGLGQFNHYNSSSFGFIHRNFLWLNKSHLLINFDGVYIGEHVKELYLPFGAESLPDELIKLFLSSKTVQTDRIKGFQKKLGDVNFFDDSADTEPLLFFTYDPKN